MTKNVSFRRTLFPCRFNECRDKINNFGRLKVAIRKMNRKKTIVSGLSD
jgi:hypothetical protein